MQTLKYIGACVFALLAVFSLCGLAELVLLKALHLTNAAPPAREVVTNLVLTLLFAVLATALSVSASKHKTPEQLK